MLFFPSHDIALGNGVRHFNPPAAALALQEDLSWLAEIWNEGLVSPLPWGWDWDTRQSLHRDYRIPLSSLPTDVQLEQIRQLSSRQSSIHILKALNYQGPMPEYICNADTLDDYIRRMDDNDQPFVLKTPWSSSGRGLIRSQVTPRTLMQQRAMAAIRRMGGIMAEPWLDKLQDFAMLFFVGSERVSFLGYSLFDSDSNGTYRHGYLMSNDDIRHRICHHDGIEDNGLLSQLTDLEQSLCNILTDMFAPFFGHGWQLGYVGIDMMSYRPSSSINEQRPSICENGQAFINPCVEMNLRCTMGVVSRLWSDRNLKAGENGLFTISPLGDDGHFQAQFKIL
ncbi:MAG: hypothetical protein KBT20_04505 [Bacteroidales bacterium]|nr:hypothetical protein [Candidatus Liminaster caballi]